MTKNTPKRGTSGRPRPGTPAKRLVIVALALAVVVVAAVITAVSARPASNELTVDFERTVALYKGSQVRILGVPVGKVTKIQPRGTAVRVTLDWDPKYPVPRDVQAVIVSPSVVGDRYVQLTPAYKSGPTLADGAYLDQSRTAIPTELDQTYRTLDDLTVALGPQGANADGSLGDLVTESAKNLDGQGEKINESLKSLATVVKTLDDNRSGNADTIKQVESLVSVLAENDTAVRRFNSTLSDVSGVLAGERDDLATSLRLLARTLGTVQDYVEENRGALKSSVDDLSRITSVLANRRTELSEILRAGPNALANFASAYNPATGALDARGTLLGLDDQFRTLTQPFFVAAYCGAASQQNPDYASACSAVSTIITQLAEFVAPTGDEATQQARTAESVSGPARGGLAQLMGVSA